MLALVFIAWRRWRTFIRTLPKYMTVMSERINIAKQDKYYHTVTKGSKWQIIKICDIDVFRLDVLAYLLQVRVLSRNTHPAERYLSQDTMMLHWCQIVNDRHTLLVSKLFLLSNLLPFVEVSAVVDKCFVDKIEDKTAILRRYDMSTKILFCRHNHVLFWKRKDRPTFK